MRGGNGSGVNPTLPTPRSFARPAVNAGSKAAKVGMIYLERTAGDMRKSPYLWWRAIAIISTTLLLLSVTTDNGRRRSGVPIIPSIPVVDAAGIPYQRGVEDHLESVPTPVSASTTHELDAISYSDSVSLRRSRLFEETDAKQFCHALLQKPKPFDRTCKRSGNSFKCLDGRVLMFSQFQQDYYLYENHFKYLNRTGIYLDIAANDAIAISNSVFFDICLGWNGGCVEANPVFITKLDRRRTCVVTPTCVGKQDNETVEFALMGGAGAVIGDTNKHAKAWEKDGTDVPTIQRTCTTVTRIAERDNMWNLDYLSLDVEGHELEVLQGIDWDRIKINVLTIEVSRDSRNKIVEKMEQLGFFLHRANLSPRNDMLGSDLVFLHRHVKWGKPV